MDIRKIEISERTGTMYMYPETGECDLIILSPFEISSLIEKCAEAMRQYHANSQFIEDEVSDD